MKNIKTYLLLVLIALFFITLIFGKAYLHEWISEAQRKYPTKNRATTMRNINSLYNYTENEEGYEHTFLEFGSKGCSACKQMERVMEQINSK